MFAGYMNKFLQVDLAKKKYFFSQPEKELYETFIGGKGLGLKLMVDMGLITHQAFSAENPMIFVTGPITGTPVQTSARSALITKSPLTDTFLDTHVGGNFGPMIKRAGLDYLIVTGKSEKPTYLHIDAQGVKFEDAGELWGKGIFECEDILKKKYPKARVCSIGPAGERLVKFACIGTDRYRQFGRGGAGAVMGSKNLKAIVIEGNEKISYFDQHSFLDLNSTLTKDILAHPNRAKRFELGTNMWIRMGQEEGHFLPTKNFQQVQFENYESLTSENMKKTLKWKSVGCFNCVIKCAKMASWEEYELEGPEYETTAYMGSGCGLADPQAVAYANYLADDLGLDTISSGVVASFAMEAFEKGVITENDTDGRTLRFGDEKALFFLLDKIAHREGLGDLLAEGTRIAAEKLGGNSNYFAIQTAGMELSGVNIKGSASMGLALATADFASHTRAWTATAEMTGQLDFSNTPQFVIDTQDEVNARNSLIVCDFLPFGFDRLAPIIQSLTGIELDEEDLMKLGEKISNLTRLYNIKNGRTRADDTLPERFFSEEHPAGIFKGKIMTKEKFGEWLNIYYDLRGWNDKGVPDDEKLADLKLKKL